MADQRKTPGAGEQPRAKFKQSKQRQFTYSPLVRQVAGGLLHGRTITRKARQQRKQSEANHANS